MDEFAAALQFPQYFGENWAAFDECLSDMEWLLPAAGIAIVMYDAVEVLADSPDELGVLVSVLDKASNAYAQPVTGGHAWDRPAVPFRLILQAGSGEVELANHRWSRAGAHITPYVGIR
jgi:hypothetical protein